jgi:hypothetical protein
LKIASLLDPKSVLNFSHTRLLKAVWIIVCKLS